MNVSKSGVSTSLGGKGATVNIGSKGLRTTVGIPGTGLSWSKQTGWAGSQGLKPSDELMQLGKLLDKHGRFFNSLSPKTNKLSAGWNKAVSAFNGGRGPSAAKLLTLAKRFDAAMSGYQAIEESVADQKIALAAIMDRLNGLRFGMFDGKLKSARNDLLTLVRDHEAGARQLADALNGLRGEVRDEFFAAERSI